MPNLEREIREYAAGCGDERFVRLSRRVYRYPRCGIATVEMAVVLPLMLVLTLAAVDFGRVMHAYLVVSNAAAYASAEVRCKAYLHEFTSYTQSNWQSNIVAAVTSEMQGLQGFSAANLQTSIATTTDSDGLFQVTVSASYPFTTVVSWPGVPSQVQLNHRVQMRQIR